MASPRSRGWSDARRGGLGPGRGGLPPGYLQHAALEPQRWADIRSRRGRAPRQSSRRPGDSWGDYRGSVKRTLVPEPTVLSAVIVPPWAVTRSRAIASPRPDPLEPGVFTKRSKTRGSNSAGIPSPGSRTETAMPPSACAALTRTEPPAGVWAIALASRLAITPLILTASADTVRRPPATSA